MNEKWTLLLASEPIAIELDRLARVGNFVPCSVHPPRGAQHLERRMRKQVDGWRRRMDGWMDARMERMGEDARNAPVRFSFVSLFIKPVCNVRAHL